MNSLLLDAYMPIYKWMHITYLWIDAYLKPLLKSKILNRLSGRTKFWSWSGQTLEIDQYQINRLDSDLEIET